MWCREGMVRTLRIVSLSGNSKFLGEGTVKRHNNAVMLEVAERARKVLQSLVMSW